MGNYDHHRKCYSLTHLRVDHSPSDVHGAQKNDIPVLQLRFLCWCIAPQKFSYRRGMYLRWHDPPVLEHSEGHLYLLNFFISGASPRLSDTC